jgi:twitching motility protein PilT
VRTGREAPPSRRTAPPPGSAQEPLPGLRPLDVVASSRAQAADGDAPGQAARGSASLLLEWLARGREAGASDLHLVPGAPPYLRVSGVLTPLEGEGELTGDALAEITRDLLYGAGYGQAWSTWYHEEHDLDLGLTLAGVGRLRISLLFDRGAPAMAVRLVSERIPSLDSLGLPAVTRSLMRRHAGLWIFTGATGSGKSTTQAAILRAILDEQPRRVITIEDPIEYVHVHGAGLVTQREVGLDTVSFERGVLGALRQDPDVILIGEMRELETIQQAVRAAETGHLVLATLHTKDAPGAIDRLIDVFPGGQQEQIRLQLSDVLLAVYAQQLVPAAPGAPEPEEKVLRGRVAAVEVLLGPMAELFATGSLIRTKKTENLVTLMESNTRMGCQTMERALAELVLAGRITEEAAMDAAVRKESLQRLLRELRA